MTLPTRTPSERSEIADASLRLTPIERAAFDGIVEAGQEPGARLAALIDLYPHLGPSELRNVRLALDELPDAPEPIRYPRPER